MLKKYSLILLPFLIVFSYLSIFSNNNSTIEPTYLVYDRDCNEFGPFELREYESMIGDGSKYLGYCILDIYATSTTVGLILTKYLITIYQLKFRVVV